MAGEDRHVHVWKVRKGKPPELHKRGLCEHQRPVRKIDVVGRWIITCSGDYVVRLWDADTGACVRETEVTIVIDQ